VTRPDGVPVMPRALVLRALGLGDFLAGVPALRGLRRALPGHRLVLAAPAALRPLVDLSDTVDELLVTGELEPIPWSGPRPEVAVDLHGNGPASKRLLEALEPARLVAFAGPGGDGRLVEGPDWDPDEHERRRWCRLVEHAFGVPADPTDLRLAVPDRKPPATDAVLVHVGAASGSRRWPEERFAAVARALTGHGCRVVLTGSPAELPARERVRVAAGLPADAIPSDTDLEDLAALVAHARYVVCGDTGMAHLASAYATPSVVLFGPTPPHRWGPPEDGPHDVLWHGTGVGDPHADAPDPALLEITVDEVLAAAEARLGL
jgi:ADP-heptose:LPS heptosyltransferase